MTVSPSRADVITMVVRVVRVSLPDVRRRISSSVTVRCRTDMVVSSSALRSPVVVRTSMPKTAKWTLPALTVCCASRRTLAVVVSSRTSICVTSPLVSVARPFSNSTPTTSLVKSAVVASTPPSATSRWRMSRVRSQSMAS